MSSWKLYAKHCPPLRHLTPHWTWSPNNRNQCTRLGFSFEHTGRPAGVSIFWKVVPLRRWTATAESSDVAASNSRSEEAKDINVSDNCSSVQAYWSAICLVRCNVPSDEHCGDVSTLFSTKVAVAHAIHGSATGRGRKLGRAIMMKSSDRNNSKTARYRLSRYTESMYVTKLVLSMSLQLATLNFKIWDASDHKNIDVKIYHRWFYLGAWYERTLK